MAATENDLGELHNELARVLTKIVGADGASAAHLAVAAKFLKDNNITCTPAADNALGELEKALAERRQRAKLSAQDRKELGGVADVEHLMH